MANIVTSRLCIVADTKTLTDIISTHEPDGSDINPLTLGGIWEDIKDGSIPEVMTADSEELPYLIKEGILELGLTCQNGPPTEWAGKVAKKYPNVYIILSGDYDEGFTEIEVYHGKETAITQYEIDHDDCEEDFEEVFEGFIKECKNG
jgi:hypothetical protein